MVFSTYSYVMEYLLDREIEVVTLSGIPSFCNLAAQLNIPLTQGEESLGVVAMTQPIEEIRQILDAHKNIVVMKISANNQLMAEELEARGLEKSFVLVSNIGMETQKVVTDINVLKGKIPYLSTMLIKKDYPLFKD
jgi:precorrin-2/cobalt-factor-2 C20-methyltransferase